MALISGSFHLAFFLPGVIFHSGESQGLFPYGFSAFYSNICSLKPFFFRSSNVFIILYTIYIYFPCLYLTCVISRVTSLKPFLTSLFKTASYASPAQPSHPLSSFAPLLFSPTVIYYILFICLFSVYLAHENIGYMEAKSLVCFVLWCISSVLNVPGMLAQIRTLHTSSYALSGLPDMYYDLTSFCLYGLEKII